MDRFETHLPSSWSFLVVPHGGTGDVREYALTASQLRWARYAISAMGGVLLMVVLALGITVPKSLAYDALIGENLELKARLQRIDDRMTEIDRILLRLRLYDAQLQSLSAPRGDHGGEDPLPPALMSNHTGQQRAFSAHPGGAEPIQVGDEYADPTRPLVVADVPAVEEEEDGWTDAADLDLPPDVFDDDHGARPPTLWAGSLEQRADSFLAQFSSSEPDLTRLVGDLEDVHALAKALPSHWPAHGYLTSGFGWRKHPLFHMWKFHSGVDIANEKGTGIHAVAPGKVVLAGSEGGLGRHVRIDHGFGIETEYGHCARLLVQDGDTVEPGQVIALMGNTGQSTGPHVHFEILIDGNPVDPLDWLPP
jgi:murein DD-endopeptidase MepM/ murein hydrolase activator NlpD